MKTTRVAFDGAIFEGQRYGGISRYFTELLRYLNRIDRCRADVVAPIYNNVHLHRAAINEGLWGFIKGFRLGSLKHTGRVRELFNRKLGQLAIDLLQPTVFHKTYYTDTWPKLGASTVRATTIHDLTYENMRGALPGSRHLIARRRKDLEIADVVICVSKTTKKELLEYYRVDEGKTRVVYHGCHMPRSNDESALSALRFAGNEPYLLYVGNRNHYKNFEVLIDAWRTSQRLKKELNIVCFGGGAFSKSELETWERRGAPTHKIKYADGNDVILASLYSNAQALVYPSLYEGFGMPLLEAMKCGCPVVCSSASCIPEIVGEAGFFFTPESSEDLTDRLLTILYDKDIRYELIKKGADHVARFTWEKCACETLDAYESV